MRKGFTLVEILVVIAIIPFVLIVLDGLFEAILFDIPQSYRVAQENTSVLNMLEQMREDIDAAKALPESFAGHATSDALMLIGLKDCVICYQLRDGQVTRCKLTDAEQDSAKEKRVWLIPHANVQWRLWKKNGIGYAIEIKTHIKHNFRGRLENKMENSHLYFLGAF